MTRLNDTKDACVLFRTIVDAAEELETNEALELLLSYAHLGLGDEVDLDTCSKVVRLILKQAIPALTAAERRYAAAVENGNKGKEAGKEKGGGVGRPKKDETPEDYQKRVDEWRAQKTPRITPEKPPMNTEQKPPENPLEVEEELEAEEEVEKKVEINKEVKIEKEYSFEELLKRFIEKHNDYDYNLTVEQFSSTYHQSLGMFQNYLSSKNRIMLSTDSLSFYLLFYKDHGEVYQENEIGIPA